LAVGHLEVCEVEGATGDAFEFGVLSSVEEDGARVAGAENLAGGEFYEVRVLVGEAGAAEFAELYCVRGGAADARELTEGVEGFLKGWERSVTHRIPIS